jgi:hypothetical protein
MQAVMTIGGIFKGTIPDETDDERREIERCVAMTAERLCLLADLNLRIFPPDSS